MRRAVDIVAGAIALMVLSPLLLLTALAVAIDSPGNPFFRAWRAGKGGRSFRMWKFRTMANRAGSPITARNDPRITRLGRFLRKTKLDELPQFINLLAGDMTLVGPRPEAPDLVTRYTPEQRAVLAVKPGLTGPVQLLAGEESESIPEGVDPRQYYLEHLMERKLRRDLDYLSVRKPLSDARIVIQTAGLLLREWRRHSCLPRRDSSRR